MYKISSKIKINKIKGQKDLEGFIIPSKKNFKILEEPITNIKVVNNQLTKNVISKIVKKKYNQLILELNNLIEDDDEDNDDKISRILDKIEKFRLLIKNKYRKFLKEKQVREMSKTLKQIQDEVIEKTLIIKNNENQIKSSKKR